VQQCRACNTAVTLKGWSPQRLPQICSLVQWLAKHAPLVKSFTAELRLDSHSLLRSVLSWEQSVQAGQLLLQQALQMTALRAALPPAAHPPAAAALQQQQQQQQQQGLRLSSFVSNCLVTLDLLAALPAHSLTRLEVNFSHSTAMDSATLSSALAQLSRLQQLSLANDVDHRCRRPSCHSCRSLLGLAQLQQLTSLRLCGYWSNSGQPLEQLFSQPLPLQELCINCNSIQPEPVLNMAALVSLRKYTAISGLPEGSVLPPQLQQLHLGKAITAGSMSALMPLQQLQHLTIIVCFEQQEPLLRLAQLPALQHVVMSYSCTVDAAASAAAWPQLPQLQDLKVGSTSPSVQQMQAILAGLAGSTQLTRLLLDVNQVTGEDDEAVDVAACQHLAGLSRLKSLTLYGEEYIDSWLKAGDVLALTALTGLTRLVLANHHSALGDLEATALACNLPQLCHLDLSNSHLGSMVCVAAIAKLTQLTDLSLLNEDNDQLTERGLMMLTTLSRLHSLHVTAYGNVSEEALEQFWAVVHAQQQQQQQQPQ
jgi:hypothetical protein